MFHQQISQVPRFCTINSCICKKQSIRSSCSSYGFNISWRLPTVWLHSEQSLFIINYSLCDVSSLALTLNQTDNNQIQEKKRKLRRKLILYTKALFFKSRNKWIKIIIIIIIANIFFESIQTDTRHRTFLTDQDFPCL